MSRAAVRSRVWLTRGQIACVALTALAGLGVLGYRADFVPFPKAPDSLLLGLGLLLWIPLFVAINRTGTLWGSGIWEGIRQFLGITLGLYLLAMGLVWLPLANGIGYAMTSALGTPFFRQIWVTTHEECSRYGCDYGFERGISRRTLFEDDIDIESALYDAFPDQRIEVVIFGKESFMGVSINSVRFVEPPTVDEP